MARGNRREAIVLDDGDRNSRGHNSRGQVIFPKIRPCQRLFTRAVLRVMRQARIRGEGLSYYHCLSRVVDRRFIFGDEEREFAVALMGKLEAFLGLRVVTYAVMSNHFHVLVEEPDRDQLPPLDRETLLRRLGFLYDGFTVESVRQELERAAATGSGVWEAEILARYQRRMGDVSIFMKEFKQRFTQWYNRRNGRKGTLWEERFKSLLVEGDEKALMTVAAYIDLNAVRAGMVERAEDYRWCGYASAVAGNRWAREGLGRILRHSSQVSGEDWEREWEATAPIYRLWLYDQGEAPEVEHDEGGIGPGGRSRAGASWKAASAAGHPAAGAISHGRSRAGSSRVRRKGVRPPSRAIRPEAPDRSEADGGSGLGGALRATGFETRPDRLDRERTEGQGRRSGDCVAQAGQEAGDVRAERREIVCV
jgi:hypothetical protein